MERIKDLSKTILRGDMLLAEVVETVTNSGLILPDTAKNGFDRMVVLAVGNSITDVVPGDIIIDIAGNIEVYPINGKKIATIIRHNILVAVHPDNFDLTASKKLITGIPNPQSVKPNPSKLLN